MAARPTQSSGRLVVAGGGLMPPRLMLVPAGISLPPGVHPVGLVTRVASSSAGLVGLGFASPADLGFASPAGLGFASSRTSLLVAAATRGSEAEGGDGDNGVGLGFASPADLGFASPAGLGFASSRTSLLVAAATRGSEAEGGDGDDSAADAKGARYEEMRHTVLLAWDHTEEGTVYQPLSVFGDWYQPLSFFADEDVVAFKERADQGTLLMRILLDRGFHYSGNDMWVLAYAGLCLRRVSAQAGHGMVWDGAVVEASLAVQLVFMRLLAGVPGPAPQDPKVAKVAYTKERLKDFVSLIEALQSVVDPE